MIGGNDLTVPRERYRDFLREIENDRLVRLASAGRVQRPLRARTLSWLGIHLSELGESLQRRYGSTSPAQDPGKATTGTLVLLVPTPVAIRTAITSAPAKPPCPAPCEEEQKVAV